MPQRPRGRERGHDWPSERRPAPPPTLRHRGSKPRAGAEAGQSVNQLENLQKVLTGHKIRHSRITDALSLCIYKYPYYIHFKLK